MTGHVITTRFAPSPTGRLHLGHALAALVAHDAARAAHGRFLLRFEDIDRTRVRPEFYQFIEHDLRWLGLAWDEPPLRQSDRLDTYAKTLDRLRLLGVVYPCFCTRREVAQELQAIVNAPHGPEGPLYPGTCRTLDRGTAQQRIAAGHSHCWRLDAAAAARLTGPLHFRDLRHGTIKVVPNLSGDVILARKDIAISYHLAVTVDDSFQGVTLVTRGEDLLPSTHVHRMLQALLEMPAPEYLHHALVFDEHGRRLAKRHDALSLETLRRHGSTPESIRQRLARTGCPEGM